MMVREMQAADTKNKMIKDELTKREETKKALAGFGQEGYDMDQAVTKLMPIDPEMALKVRESLRKSTKEQIDLLGAGAKLTEQYAPMMMDNPAAYIQYYKTMGGLGLAGPLPHPNSFLSQDGQSFNMPVFNEALKRIVGLKDIIKSELEGPKAPQTRDVKQGDQIVTQEWDKTTGQWKNVGTGPRWDPEKNQITVAPDGTVTIGKGGQTGSGLPKKVEGDVYEKLLGATENLRGIQETDANLKPEYLEYFGQFGNWVNKQREKFGGQLDDETKKKVEGFTTFVASAKSLHSKILKNLSGLAVTAAEEERIKAFTIDPDKDSGTTAQTKLKRLEEDTKRVIVRSNFARKHGLSIRNTDKLDYELQVMKDKVKQGIISQLTPEQRSKTPDDKIEEQALRRVAEEYMLVY
jgi:hypothetical protein